MSANPSATSTAGGDDTPAVFEPGKNLAEAAGQGEENEETVAEQRAKLFNLVEGNMVSIGLGQLKLKRVLEAGSEAGPRKRRLLMRTDGAGHVVLVSTYLYGCVRIYLAEATGDRSCCWQCLQNMGILPSFDPIVEGKFIRFVGFDTTGKPRPYAVQVKTPQAASELGGKMKAEVEALKREAGGSA
jgi:nucleoporin NUP2